MDYQTLSTHWHLRDIRNKVSSRSRTEIIFRFITLKVNKSKFTLNRCSRTATVCFHLNGKKRSSLMKLASQEDQARKGDVLSFLWPKLCLHHCSTQSRVEGDHWRTVPPSPARSCPRHHRAMRPTAWETHGSAFNTSLRRRVPPPPHYGPSGPDRCLRRWRDPGCLSGVCARCHSTYLPLVEPGNVPRHRHHMRGWVAGAKSA